MLGSVAFRAWGGRTYYQSHAISFQDQGDTVAGVLNMPKGSREEAAVRPLIIFVHGDGDLNATAYGYYKPVWNELAKQGIATMSWDKKGVGNSTGQWLQQSMEDRAWEVIRAIDYIKSDTTYNFSFVGLLGFSQAGWVLPKVAALSTYPDLMILVSGAINWKRQSQYLTRKKLLRSGASEAAIAVVLRQHQRDLRWFDLSVSYEEYAAHAREQCEKRSGSSCSIMDADRFRFVQKNMNSDASEDLATIRCPIMAIFGAEDLNVDYLETYQTYERIFLQSSPNNYQLKIYPDATHGLLKSSQFNTPEPGLWFIVKLWLYGRQAFAADVLEDIASFVREH